MDAVTEEPTSPNNDDIDNPNDSEIEQGEITTEETKMTKVRKKMFLTTLKIQLMKQQNQQNML